ncbi:MAG: OmpA family protein [Bacteroidota bacterium]|nr:OmpA family protein [Bacteroidota bacterium]
MKNSFFGFIALWFLHSNMLFAQTYDEKIAFGKVLKEAKATLEVDEYKDALDLFFQADSLKPFNPEINYYIGECYIKLNHEAKAFSHLKLAEDSGYINPHLNFLLGITYKLNYKFEIAINHFEKYKAAVQANTNKKTIFDFTIADADRQINNCKNAIELMKNPIEVHIYNLGPKINSKFADYVPCVSADETELIFTSRRDNSTGGKTDADGRYFEDIYISHKLDSSWSSAVKLGFGINTPDHDACVGLSPDGNEMYIYRNVKRSGDIFVSDQKNDIWSTPVKMDPAINSPHWEPSGSTTNDENTFFFTSDRPGGYGGRDIYMARKLPNGKFDKAINMGPKINTADDEDAPFIHTDGKTLYFSSKGHKGLGGFDIFHCRVNVLTGEVLQEPENIGYPINTPDDEIYFVWSADGKRAYFSSDRPGGYGDKDIYMLERKTTEAVLAILKGLVIDVKTKQPKAATIVINDIQNKKTHGVYTSNAINGKFMVILPPGRDYGIEVDAKGYLFYSKNIDVPDTLSHYEEINDTVRLEPIEIGSRVVLRNIFFDKNSAVVRNESFFELNKVVTLMNDNPKMRIQLSAHCSSEGDDNYNLKLSENRALSVKKYLNSKGIDENRLENKGFGETKPIIFPDDTEEKRMQNRRVELLVVE